MAPIGYPELNHEYYHCVHRVAKVKAATYVSFFTTVYGDDNLYVRVSIAKNYGIVEQFQELPDNRAEVQITTTAFRNDSMFTSVSFSDVSFLFCDTGGVCDYADGSGKFDITHRLEQILVHKLEHPKPTKRAALFL